MIELPQVMTESEGSASEYWWSGSGMPIAPFSLKAGQPHLSDFPENETLGQLYAYRVSHTEMLLGTREGAYPETLQSNNSRATGVLIGISSVSNGLYRCVARNANASRTITVTINVQGMSQEAYDSLASSILISYTTPSDPAVTTSNQTTAYLRTSVADVTMLVEQLFFHNEAYITALLSTMVLYW